MKRLLYIVLVVAFAAAAVSCEKSEKRKEYTSPCADLEVKGVVKDDNGAALSSMTVRIAHTDKNSSEYTFTTDDVVRTSSDGTFSNKYTEFYPPYTNLALTVTDPSGTYKDKTVYYKNLIYDDAYGLYEGSCSVDFGTITLYKKNK